MYHETQTSDRACFITLTYDEENVPEKLDKSHFQNFIKILRHHSGRELRYFACGEYGEETRRPHYHCMLFGEDFLGGAYQRDDILYGNKIVDALWGKGFVAIGGVSMASACYVAGYVNKKLNDPDTFNLMSRKPPLGLPWVKKHWRELEASGRVVVEGQELPIPAVYAKWLGLPRVIESRTENVKQLWEPQRKAREWAAKTRKQLKNRGHI